MKDLTDFTAVGKEFGLTGEELMNFAKDELANYKEECKKKKKKKNSVDWKKKKEKKSVDWK